MYSREQFLKGMGAVGALTFLTGTCVGFKLAQSAVRSMDAIGPVQGPPEMPEYGPGNTPLYGPPAPGSAPEAIRPTPSPTASAFSSLDLKGLYTSDFQMRRQILDQAKVFMPISPSTEKGNESNYALRVRLESNLWNDLEQHGAGVSDVLLALESSFTVTGRAWGMQMLWDMRDSGQLTKYGANPLDQARKDWADNYRMEIKNDQGGVVYSSIIDYRLLAVVKDVFVPTAEILDAGRDFFFEAVPADQRKSIKVEERIPNPGLVSGLQMIETGTIHPRVDQLPEKGSVPPVPPRNRGYIHVGDGLAWDQINLKESLFPSGHDDLTWLADMMERNTGLPYKDNVTKIPGSVGGSEDASGGAPDNQIMPINRRVLINAYNEANKRLGLKYPVPVLFEPFMSMMFVNFYLAAETFHRQMSADQSPSTFVRRGYRAGDESSMLAALGKWNPNDGEVNAALNAGYDYYAKFNRI